ncbi:MAG: ECF subfamily [Verrucomicrobia bacterium]|nr:MAG: ECF subfamily [Verrucomicrobiota bacterium]
MWRRFSQFEKGSDFLAWAFAVASFEAKNFVRISGRSIVKFDDSLLETLSEHRAVDIRQHDGRLDALEECIGKLDSQSRALIEAVYTRGEEVKEIAGREGRAPQTFYNRLNFIRRILTDCIRSKASPLKL